MRNGKFWKDVTGQRLSAKCSKQGETVKLASSDSCLPLSSEMRMLLTSRHREGTFFYLRVYNLHLEVRRSFCTCFFSNIFSLKCPICQSAIFWYSVSWALSCLLLPSVPTALPYLYPILFFLLHFWFIFSGIFFFLLIHSVDIYTFLFNSCRAFWRGHHCYIFSNQHFLPTNLSLCIVENLLYLIFGLSWTMNNLWLLDQWPIPQT